jgi:hypothetical protein
MEVLLCDIMHGTQYHVDWLIMLIAVSKMQDYRIMIAMTAPYSG